MNLKKLVQRAQRQRENKPKKQQEEVPFLPVYAEVGSELELQKLAYTNPLIIDEELFTLPAFTDADRESIIQRTAYARYQLNWMMAHGFGLGHLLRMLQKWFTRLPDEEKLSSDYRAYLSQSLATVFPEYLAGTGIDNQGTIWVSFSEFINNEYQDQDYMKSLLDPWMFNWYRDYQNQA